LPSATKSTRWIISSAPGAETHRDGAVGSPPDLSLKYGRSECDSTVEIDGVQGEVTQARTHASDAIGRGAPSAVVESIRICWLAAGENWLSRLLER